LGGKNLPIVPNAATLRKAKEEQLLKMHGLEFVNAPLNLFHHSETGKYAGSIHSISLLKFHCIYWSAEQQQIYTARCKNNSDAILTIDATGSIAKQLKKNDPHIFLYQCMLVTTEGSVPVFQMVSGDQRSFAIANFLRLILVKGAPRPPMVVCDCSRALLNAIADVFGKSNDLLDYLNKCYDTVVRGSPSIPMTFIRLDVSHFVKMVSRWKCLNAMITAARRFYIRCMSQAYQMNDFTALSDFLESLLIVAMSEFIGDTNDVPAETRMRSLTKTIQGICIPESTADTEEKNKDDDLDSNEIDADWDMWANTLYENAQRIASQSNEGTTINACFNPEFAQRLRKQLFPILPLWTGVMRPYFAKSPIIATSASVESEFADLKHRAFSIKLPMQFDKFVFQHLDYLDGKVKLASNQKDLSHENSASKEKDMSIETSGNFERDSETEEGLINLTVETASPIMEKLKSPQFCSKNDKIKHGTSQNSTTSRKHENSGLIGLIDVGQANEIDTKIEKSDRSDTYNMQDFSIYNISNDILSSTKNDEIEILNTCENWRVEKLAKDSIHLINHRKRPKEQNLPI